mmetsp:Transcript_9764/g.29127  ORF Transcript_9764/g.29127 Transcript_9764/m.29127 type:complete len:207 (+) Transcript_9764:687-1307(+)
MSLNEFTLFATIHYLGNMCHDAWLQSSLLAKLEQRADIILALLQSLGFIPSRCAAFCSLGTAGKIVLPLPEQPFEETVDALVRVVFVISVFLPGNAFATLFGHLDALRLCFRSIACHRFGISSRPLRRIVLVTDVFAISPATLLGQERIPDAVTAPQAELVHLTHPSSGGFAALPRLVQSIQSGFIVEPATTKIDRPLAKEPDGQP